MERLRIAIDYRPAILSSAGIGRAVRELCRALAARPDVELHLFAHSLRPAARADEPPPGARLHRLPVPGHALDWLCRRGLDAAALAGGCPLFHWTDYVHPPIRDAVTGVLTVHDLAFAEDPTYHGAASARLLERTRRAADRAALVVTPSASTAAACRQHLGVDPTRLRVVPFGADHVPEAGDDEAVGRGYLLAVGTIEPRKNHLALLRALTHVPRPRPRLVVVGACGWECEATVAALEEAERQGDVDWHDDADDEEMFALLRGATALIYPSKLEGFGFPPVEAMRCGVPVVAGDVPGLHDTLGDAARYCDPDDPLSIAQAIDEVVRHNGVRSALRERGLRRAAELTWARAAAAHVAAYREALATA